MTAPDPQQPGFTAQLHHRDRIAEQLVQPEILAEAEVGKPAIRRADGRLSSRDSRKTTKR